ncbi:MAG: ATP-binding cassette domain-containing protein [Candidatus Saccharibacteria bacterium]|nr:ATP-binding cassette domain-containing protein [Candidatus Saccharibacteria bacterium]
MKSNTAISVEKLSKEFRLRGNRHILSGIFRPEWQTATAVSEVDIAIASGEAVAFLGPNGAGKTTTTKMLTGLIKPTSGQLHVLGYSPFERNYAFLKKIGLVMGNKAGLNWDLSARQSFELLQKLYEIPISAYHGRVKELTELLQVSHVLDSQVRKLSLGERMKLELIGAILHDPEILFLDEPTIGLDISSKRNVRKFLSYLHEQGKTLLLTSHDMDDIVEVCDRALVINHGRIIFDDSMDKLSHQYSNIRYARLEFVDASPNRSFAEKYGEVLEAKGNKLVIGADKKQIMKVIATISDKYPIQDVAIERVPLELIIEDLYTKTP